MDLYKGIQQILHQQNIYHTEVWLANATEFSL